MAVDPAQVIIDALSGPQEVETDGVKAKAYSAKDLIALLNHAASLSVTGSGWTRCRAARVVPPGAIGPRDQNADPLIQGFIG